LAVSCGESNYEKAKIQATDDGDTDPPEE